LSLKSYLLIPNDDLEFADPTLLFCFPNKFGSINELEMLLFSNGFLKVNGSSFVLN
jgi:hypothetical protein